MTPEALQRLEAALAQHEQKYKGESFCREPNVHDIYRADLRALLEERRWISVQEKLPEAGGTYLVAVDRKMRSIIPASKYEHCVEFGFLVYFETGPKWSITGTWPDNENVVTHWKPLPAPPTTPSPEEEK